MKWMKAGLFACVFMASALVGALAFGQDVTPAPAGIDWQAQVIGMISAITPFVVALITQLVKLGVGKVSSKVPGFVWPIVAMVLGTVGTTIAQSATVKGGVVGAFLGLAAVGVYEISKGLKAS